MASCGMVQQMALWQHPPVTGSGVVEYTLVVPPEHRRAAAALCRRHPRWRADGGRQCVCLPHLCQRRAAVEHDEAVHDVGALPIDLPSLAGQEIVIQFMTDGAGRQPLELGRVG